MYELATIKPPPDASRQPMQSVPSIIQIFEIQFFFVIPSKARGKSLKSIASSIASHNARKTVLLLNLPESHI